MISKLLGIRGAGQTGGIAETLFVTVSAAERHTTSIFTKLGLTEEGGEHRRVLAVLRYLRR